MKIQNVKPENVSKDILENVHTTADIAGVNSELIALFYHIDRVDPVLQELKELKENVLRYFICTLRPIPTCYECDNCHEIFTNECQLEQHIETYPSV